MSLFNRPVFIANDLGARPCPTRQVLIPGILAVVLIVL
jgi:hypothetical protein